MLSLNKNIEDPKRRQLILIIIIVVIVLALSVSLFAVLFMTHDKNKNKGSYYDPGSGETIGNETGKAPESFGGAPGQPVFLGYSKLLDNGITATQLDQVKQGWSQFALKQPEKIKEISLTVSSISWEGLDPNNPQPTQRLAFETTVNRTKKYQVTLLYPDTSSVKMIISDGPTQVFTFQGQLVD